MSKSLIRKNQLHPDIQDLVAEYGGSLFVSSENFNQLSGNLSNILGADITFAVFTTGDQNISGLKNFSSRPTVNNTGILLQGEGATLPNGLLYTTGQQTISSEKEFTIRPLFNGVGFATTGDINTKTLFNGNRPITRTNINGVIPQGNDVISFLNNLFYPFTQATLTLNSFDTVYELGRTLNSVNFVGTINTGSLNINQISNLQGFINDSPIPNPVSPSLNFNFPVQVNLNNSSDNITVRANSVNENNQTVQIISNPRSIKFEAPFYFGSGAANLTAAQIQSQLISRIETKSNKFLTYTANNQKLYFVYPQSWDPLLKIIDQNTFDNTNGWFIRPGIFTLFNGSTHPYTIRETVLFSTFLTPFSYTFNFINQ